MHTSWAYLCPSTYSPGVPAPGSPLCHATLTVPRGVLNAGLTPLLNHLSPGRPSLTGPSCSPSLPRPASRGLVPVPVSRHHPRINSPGQSAASQPLWSLPTPSVLPRTGPQGYRGPSGSNVSPHLCHVSINPTSLNWARLKCSQARRGYSYLQETSYQSSPQR